MSNLEKSYLHGIAFIKKRARIVHKSKGFWKGRKIIPAEEWMKKQKHYNFEEPLGFLPDGYDSNKIFFYLPPENEKQYNARKLWWNDYHDFLTETKNPDYGSRMCKSCPFNEFKISWGLDKFLLRYLEKNLVNYKPTCDIINSFECPHGNQKVASLLTILGNMFLMVDEALKYCWDVRRKHDFAHYIDYNREVAGRSKPITNEIWKETLGLKVPRLPLSNVMDVYNVLTNPELMDFMIDQYVDAVGTDVYRRVVYMGYSQNFNVEQVELFRPYLLNLFEKNKDLLRLEDLVDCYDYTLEEEESKRQEEEKDLARLKVEEPEIYQKRMDRKNSGLCQICNGFAKVFCVNCKTWICADHWEQHGIDVHGFILKFPSYFNRDW